MAPADASRPDSSGADGYRSDRNASTALLNASGRSEHDLWPEPSITERSAFGSAETRRSEYTRGISMSSLPQSTSAGASIPPRRSSTDQSRIERSIAV